MPARVNSDHLTALGFLGMAAAGISYYFAQLTPWAFAAATVCLAINWFGDSLDGTVARLRDRQRPRYGFYIDHVADAVGALFLIGGLGLSGYMTGTVAMALIIAYFLLSIELYLATYATGVFHLSFGIWGPTELRVVLAIGNIALMFRSTATIAGTRYLLCDVGAVVAIVGITAVFIVSVIRNTVRLYREERLP